MPDEVTYLREATSRLLAGSTKAAVVRWMGEEGFVTTAGNPWTTVVLTRTLLNPRLAGLGSKGDPIEGAPIVITPAERAGLLALHPQHADAPGDEKKAPDEREWILAGVGAAGQCGLCGAGLEVSWVGAGKPSYRCPPPPPMTSQVDDVTGAVESGRSLKASPCGRIRMTAPLLEDAVAEQVLAELLRPEARDRFEALLADVRAEIERLRDHQRRTEKTLQAVKSALRSAPDSTRAALTEAQKAAQKDGRDTRTRLRYLEQIVDVAPPVGEAEGLVRWWNAAPLSSKRALVALEIKVVRVNPGRRGRNANPHDRIDILWN
ncbi:hypothetical protein [Streptomyces abikoensis]|uniref:Recombinase domain-containing protein n=1 Tax=Streptomyces abikoensis TaxID=97398 RepID=A0ABW7T7G6_9ACTN